MFVSNKTVNIYNFQKKNHVKLQNHTVGSSENLRHVIPIPIVFFSVFFPFFLSIFFSDFLFFSNCYVLLFKSMRF